jgi:hypothetical protein
MKIIIHSSNDIELQLLCSRRRKHIFTELCEQLIICYCLQFAFLFTLMLLVAPRSLNAVFKSIFSVRFIITKFSIDDTPSSSRSSWSRCWSKKSKKASLGLYGAWSAKGGFWYNTKSNSYRLRIVLRLS